MDPRTLLKLPPAARRPILEQQAADADSAGLYHDWDEETNDGKGWALTSFTCPYCGHLHNAVHPADVDSRTLVCPRCGQREIEPPAPN